MKKENQTIVISGYAAISPVGLDAGQTCASIRAGITRFAEHAYYECEGADPEWDEEEPLTASAVPSIDPFVDGPERLFQLVIPALGQLLSATKLKRKEIEAGGFLLALPQADAIIESWSLRDAFFPELFKRTAMSPFKINKVDQSGHTGVFRMIQEAVQLLLSRQVSFCIVGGADSYLMEERLAYLDRSWRIKSTKAIDGFIPGEAVTLLLLERPEEVRHNRRPTLATISNCGFGQEPQPVHSDRNSTGTGLGEAIQKALHPMGADTAIDWVMCDLNGESYRGFEWGLVQTRLKSFFPGIKNLSHPADTIGDVGAATGGLLVACAVHAFQRGYHISDKALLWTASDDGLRAALCIHNGKNENQEVV